MRACCRRLTKETVKVCGRQLGKVCLTYPMIAFDFMLERIQSFQNLIGPVVESMKYLSDLAFDVLSCKSICCSLENIYAFLFSLVCRLVDRESRRAVKADAQDERRNAEHMAHRPYVRICRLIKN